MTASSRFSRNYHGRVMSALPMVDVSGEGWGLVDTYFRWGRGTDYVPNCRDEHIENFWPLVKGLGAVEKHFGTLVNYDESCISGISMSPGVVRQRIWRKTGTNLDGGSNPPSSWR